MTLSEYISSPVPEGQRNHALFIAALQALEHGWDEDKIRLELGGKALFDGLKQAEINNTIASAMKHTITPRQQYMPAPRKGGAYKWGDVIPAIDLDWVEDAELPPPEKHGWEEVVEYLQALFHPGEYVGYVMDAAGRDGKLLPANRGNYKRTAKELIDGLRKHKSVRKVLGAPDEAAGAWIRFNPLDGEGIRDSNVTAYRYALVESDDENLPPEKQAALYLELELPIAVMVHSGKKSMHAIVRIDAKSYQEYRERVDYLHEVCSKNGIQIDRANKNPSRLSRLPGVMRDGQRQYIAGKASGKRTFQEWKEHIESLDDDLPDIRSFAHVLPNMPPLAPELIHGILRQGHKLFVSGPSKAAKSFLMLNLAISVAEGKPLMDTWQCKQGKVLYINLELDEPSCWHRIQSLYDSMRLKPKCAHNLDVWNLRGKGQAMDALTPKLIRRAKARRYMMVIFDPIYKILTGDENSAYEMSVFTSLFDRVAEELGASPVFCHHHSKGQQGQKSAKDRASGSGVFARDGDAILDLIELQLSPEQREIVEEKHRIEGRSMGEFWSAWRIEGDLREFPPLQQTRLFFDFPMHFPDKFDLLADARAAGELPPKQSATERKESQMLALQTAWQTAYDSTVNGAPVLDLAHHLGVTDVTVKRRIQGTKHLAIYEDVVVKKAEYYRIAISDAIRKLNAKGEDATAANVAEMLNVTDRTVRRNLKNNGFVITDNIITRT